MKIDREEVVRIAALARLRPDEDSLARLQRDLGSILDHVERLTRLDVADADPVEPPTREGGELRPDRRAPGLSVDEALSNAPDAADGMFRVPRVLTDRT